MRASSTRAGGFSLVEVLVVIAIAGLLVGLLLPALGMARERANSIQCQATLRSIGAAAYSHALDHRGYLPVAGMHDSNRVTPDNEGLGDREARRFTYFEEDGDKRPVPFTVALAVQMGVSVRLENRDVLEEDMQRDDLRRHFRCPSQTEELQGLTQSIGPWRAPYEWSSYVFGEAVLGTRDKTWDFPRGKLSKVRRPSAVMLAMDGRPRYPEGTELNWLFIQEFSPDCTVWDYRKLTRDPSCDWLGRQGLDDLRHNWRANVLFVDGHCESVPMTDDGLRTIGTSKGIYE